MKYADYLKSEHWKNLKKGKQKKYGKQKRCAICGETNRIDLHHLFYRDLENVKLSDLRYLCRRCHKLAHTLLIEYKLIGSHHSKFAILKNKVKQHLGISNKNLFPGKG